MRTILLAKSQQNGGLTLLEHTSHVVECSVALAQYYGVDSSLARSAAILHDLGKGHPYFQGLLHGKKQSDELPHRHEISSLLFLPLFDKRYWGELVEMIVSHHKSLIQDVGERGLLDLVEQYGEDAVFNRHSENWKSWAGEVVNSVIQHLAIETKAIPIVQAREAFDFAVSFCRSKKKGRNFNKGFLITADHWASAFTFQSVRKLQEAFQPPDLNFYDDPQRQSNIYHLSLIDTTDSRPHTLVTAPTGAGKTDFLMRRTRGRVFYTLPFQASINAMYARFLCTIKGDIRRLHGASSIELDEEWGEDVSSQSHPGASVKILTPHQLASIVLGTKGHEALALDIRGNDIILDEIHVYSDVSQSLVLAIIRAAEKMGCRIHVGTATMPTLLREEILKVLEVENTYHVTLSEPQLITYNRHKVYKHTDMDDALSVVSGALSQGEKLIIVTNTVKDAQLLYKRLKSLYRVPMLLLHSRFRRKDRAALEQKLMADFDGKDGPCIVVSTQVVEVSLDISFDRMITEAAPLDSLAQRFGRVNRRRSLATLGTLKPVHVVWDGKKHLPYKKELIERTWSALPNKGEIMKEVDLQHNMDKVYPTLDVKEISSHLVEDDFGFKLKELVHKSRSCLVKLLDIESNVVILESDQEDYRIQTEPRQNYEIPVPRSSLSVFMRGDGASRLPYGCEPVVVSDSYYDKEIGFAVEQDKTVEERML